MSAQRVYDVRFEMLTEVCTHRLTQPPILLENTPIAVSVAGIPWGTICGACTAKRRAAALPVGQKQENEESRGVCMMKIIATNISSPVEDLAREGPNASLDLQLDERNAFISASETPVLLLVF